jgi:hypothetical protein
LDEIKSVLRLRTVSAVDGTDRKWRLFMANKYNREGYADPTACEALRRIEREEKVARYRPLVYMRKAFVTVSRIFLFPKIATT